MSDVFFAKLGRIILWCSGWCGTLDETGLVVEVRWRVGRGGVVCMSLSRGATVLYSTVQYVQYSFHPSAFTAVLEAAR